MATIKTAISIQESLFEQVDELAEELAVPRSQLFVLAVTEFIERHRSKKMLQTLDEVYADASGPDEPVVRVGMQRQHRQLLEGEW